MTNYHHFLLTWINWVVFINYIVKKTVYDKLVKVINIDTSTFVLKTKYQTDKAELEKKIPNVTYFVKKKTKKTHQIRKQNSRRK